MEKVITLEGHEQRRSGNRKKAMSREDQDNRKKVMSREGQDHRGSFVR
jgi:hypothetical protein